MRIMRLVPSLANLEEYAHIRGTTTLSYHSEMNLLREEGFVIPTGWKRGMEGFGWEVQEMIYPNVYLASKYLRENDSKYRKFQTLADEDILFDALTLQIRQFSPDFLLFYGGVLMSISRAQRETLRLALESGKRVRFIGFWGDEIKSWQDYKSLFSDLEFIFVTSQEYKIKLDRAGLKTAVIGNCFDSALSFSPQTPKDIDILFCGSTGYMAIDHIGRYEFLRRLLSVRKVTLVTTEDKSVYNGVFYGRVLVAQVLVIFPLEMLNYLSTLSRRYLSGRCLGVLNAALEFRRLGRPIVDSLDSWKSPTGYSFRNKEPLTKIFPQNARAAVRTRREYFELLSRAKVVLNIHRDEDADVGNIRCFEVTGVGSCLLTDKADTLDQFFAPGIEVATFKTFDQCVEMIDKLLNDPPLREGIASRGHQKTCDAHLEKNRCELFDSYLRSM